MFLSISHFYNKNIYRLKLCLLSGELIREYSRNFGFRRNEGQKLSLNNISINNVFFRKKRFVAFHVNLHIFVISMKRLLGTSRCLQIHSFCTNILKAITSVQ